MKSFTMSPLKITKGTDAQSSRESSVSSRAAFSWMSDTTANVYGPAARSSVRNESVSPVTVSPHFTMCCFS